MAQEHRQVCLQEQEGYRDTRLGALRVFSPMAGISYPTTTRGSLPLAQLGCREDPCTRGPHWLRNL